MKRITIMFIILLVIATLAFCLPLYYGLVVPFLFPASSRDIYQGLSYYFDETYLDYDNGQDFQRMLQKYDILESGTVQDFYYIDNRLGDDPFWGKQCDVYALDVSYTQDVYSDLKAEVSFVAEGCESQDDYLGFVLPHDSSFGDLVRIISFCDKTNVVRYTLVSDSNYYKPNHYNSFSSMIRKNSTLNYYADGIPAIDESKQPLLEFDLFKYSIEDGEVTILSREYDYEEMFIVPEKIDEFPVRVLGESSLYQHTRTEQIVLAQTLETIGDKCFYQCYSLKNITIPQNVVQIGKDVFAKCRVLEEINVDTKNEQYSSEDGILYDKEKAVLLFYPEGKSGEEFIIPETVKKLEEGCFGYQTQLKRIIIPATVTEFPNCNLFASADSITLIVEEWGQGDGSVVP